MNLQALRQELATPRTSVQLCLLGIVGGACAASLIILFRLCVEWIQSIYLPGLNQYGSLPAHWRFALPFAGAALILFVAYLTGLKHYRMGIPFVIHRVKHHFGQIPFQTTLNQFFGGMIALASGFVVGREGPSVHLGAAGSGFLGSWLNLPYNSIRILAGCGIAAGISASFNTPFAAVIFVMEVVLREYKIHIFIPVMLAAALGSVMTRAVFGETHELSFLLFQSVSQWYYLYLVLFGVVLGCFAALFNNQMMFVIRKARRIRMRWRFVIAAAVTGLTGALLPDAMGAGLDSVHGILNSHSLWLILAILAAKFILALTAIGLGIPGGVIGPIYVLGMLSGALLAMPLSALFAAPESLANSFAILGIAGLLTAVLHAPLAALSSVMELSNNPEVILPAMLVIVPAYVTSTQLLGNSSLFIRQLEYQKLPYTMSSIRESLQKTGVLAAMDREFKLFTDAQDKHILSFLATAPTRPVVMHSRFEIDGQYSLVQYDVSLGHESTPLAYFQMQGLGEQATLAEVYEILQVSREGAVYIHEADQLDKIIGVITWNNLRSYLHREQF